MAIRFMLTIPGRKTSTLDCHSQSQIGVNSGPRIFLLRTGTIFLRFLRLQSLIHILNHFKSFTFWKTVNN